MPTLFGLSVVARVRSNRTCFYLNAAWQQQRRSVIQKPEKYTRVMVDDHKYDQQTEETAEHI